jgi:hypothetical protein
VGTVNHAFAFGDLVDGIDENGTLALELLDDEAVVNDLFANVNGRTEGLERDADDVDRANNSGTKTPGFKQK